MTDKRQVAMLPMGLETGIRMLPFFLAGTEVAWTMKNMEKSGRKTLAFLADKFVWKKTALSISCLVFLGICVLSAKQNSLILYHRDRYGQEGLFYLGAVSGICLIIGAGMLFERCKWILYMGQHTMWILLFHKFPLLFFQVLVPGMGKMLEESNPAAGMLVTAFAVASCLVFEAAAKKLWKKILPFCSDFYGKVTP